MGHTCHLRSDGDIRHTLPVGTGRITPEISFELVPEAILAQPHGHGGGHPERTAKSCVAILRQLGGAAKLARLLGREIEATELEELTMVVEAAQVAGLGQDRESQDRADAWHLLETPKVGVVLHVACSSFFQLIAQLTQANHLPKHYSEHRHCF